MTAGAIGFWVVLGVYGAVVAPASVDPPAPVDQSEVGLSENKGSAPTAPKLPQTAEVTVADLVAALEAVAQLREGDGDLRREYLRRTTSRIRAPTDPHPSLFQQAACLLSES